MFSNEIVNCKFLVDCKTLLFNLSVLDFWMNLHVIDEWNRWMKLIDKFSPLWWKGTIQWHFDRTLTFWFCSFLFSFLPIRSHFVLLQFEHLQLLFLYFDTTICTYVLKYSKWSSFPSLSRGVYPLSLPYVRRRRGVSYGYILMFPFLIPRYTHSSFRHKYSMRVEASYY